MKTDKLVIANWKMNPSTLSEANELFEITKKTALTTRNVTTIIAPPTIFLHSLASSTRAKRLRFAVQNVHFNMIGPQVGEASVLQAKDSGAIYALIGHSDRRSAGETNEDLNKKVLVALDVKLTPIVFVGETERDNNGNFLRTLRRQIMSLLKNVPQNRVKDIIFVYEPVWAISTNLSKVSQEITPNEIHKMVLYIRKVLVEVYDLSIARKVRVLYGGSVNSQNISDVLSVLGITGVVIGAASLDGEQIRRMLQIANKL